GRYLPQVGGGQSQDEAALRLRPDVAKDRHRRVQQFGRRRQDRPATTRRTPPSAERGDQRSRSRDHPISLRGVGPEVAGQLL
ncbi:MAG: hypothetical protein AVDCRST_MAG75-330, partial [uncultured Propionibacteriaceae bacterium]